MPPVVALRSQFFTERERYPRFASSVTDLKWVDAVSSMGRLAGAFKMVKQAHRIVYYQL
jgi:hypothetical protein